MNEGHGHGDMRMTAVPGGLVSVLILLPNLLWMLFAPRGQPEDGTGPANGLHRGAVNLERAGRIATLVIPFFYRIEVQSTRQIVAPMVIVLAYLLYYGGWARYFLRGRSHALLFESFLWLPLPLAISPIVNLLAASLLFGSWYLALANMFLAVGISGSPSRRPGRHRAGHEDGRAAGSYQGTGQRTRLHVV